MMRAMLFAVLLGLVQYFSKNLRKKCQQVEMTSFSAGIAVTYLFLELMPKIDGPLPQAWYFVTPLIGFVVVHLIEKYIYQHSPKDRWQRQVGVEESAVLFLYHVIVGMILALIAEDGWLQAVLFFIPMMFYTAIRATRFEDTLSWYIRLGMSAATAVGVALTIAFNLATLQTLLIGFIVGALLFTTSRHMLPFDKQGRPAYFTLGVVVYGILIGMSWFL